MRLWKVVVLLNLALALGVAAGYVWWGRRAERLQRELGEARAAQAGVEREWTVRGVVRAILPEAGLLIISHEEIPGYMEPMTMGFRVASPQIYDRVRIGDAVRFTLRGAPPAVIVTGIERAPVGGARR
ncbi:MAG: copper-binding protein [Candidatus Rokuibacteriota bacterium]